MGHYNPCLFRVAWALHVHTNIGRLYPYLLRLVYILLMRALYVLHPYVTDAAVELRIIRAFCKI